MGQGISLKSERNTHDLTFYCTHNQLCVPQYIRSMFRVLEIYNFALCTACVCILKKFCHDITLKVLKYFKSISCSFKREQRSEAKLWKNEMKNPRAPAETMSRELAAFFWNLWMTSNQLEATFCNEFGCPSLWQIMTIA